MGVEGATSPLNDPGLVLLGAIRTPRTLSNDPGPVLLGAIVSEKKIVKKKCFFPLFSLNCYSSAPIGPIWTKKMWSQRARRVLSNDQGSVLVGAIVSEKKYC
ncbi:hypothetical protein V1477_006356 [Vespula maculifrons]|uniref:Uncharacterized protein n=1 Tax=Vespula maculifrons TaxID=7453 RepID=A0ABD2CKG2_VESMC